MRSSIHLLLVAITLTLAGCASQPRAPLFLDAGLQGAGVRSIAILPVTFDSRYAPPYDTDVDGELRSDLAGALHRKGYRIVAAGDSSADARLTVHVDFLIIDPLTLERNPPPSIEIEAVARLVTVADGRELWRDRGQARSDNTLIIYPEAERALVLSRLADRLLATLPAAAHP